MAAVSEKYSPRGVQYWRTHLMNEFLPIMPHTGQSLIEQLKDANISSHQVAHIVAQDPILGIQVVKEANRLNTKNQHTDITNIEHCVAIMGLDNIHRLAHKIPILDPSAEYNETQYYLNAIIRSLHAAVQARSWAVQRSYHAPHEIFLASLFYGVPMWYLWQLATSEMLTIHHLTQNEMVPATTAEKTVLGCTINTLCLALAVEWKLPKIVQNAFDPAFHPDNRFLMATARQVSSDSFPELPAYDTKGVATNSPAVQVILANWLCRETDIDWSSRQTDRAMKVISAFLRMPLPETRKLILQNALEVSRAYPIPGILTPGASLLFPPSPPKHREVKLAEIATLAKKLVIEAGPNEKHKHLSAQQISDNPELTRSFNWTKQSQSLFEVDIENFNDKNTSIMEAEQPHKQRSPDHGLFKEFTDSIRSHPEKYRNTNELFELACEALQVGLGLERVIFAVKNKNGRQLQSRSSTGCTQNPALQYFECPLNDEGLFHTLLKKSSSIWVNKDNLDNALKQLPKEFRDHCQVEEFFMMSILRGSNTLGICYVDQGPNGEKLRKEHYNAYKYLCNSVTKCLTAQTGHISIK